MTDFVDGDFFRFGENGLGRVVRRGLECVFFEKEADFVARGEEVVVTNVRFVVVSTCRELGQRVVGEVERGQHLMRVIEERGAGFFGKVVRDNEVAILIEG